MPRIKSDVRDSVKQKLGEELRRMQKEDPESLKIFLSSLSEAEANEIFYDQEIWARESQYFDLADGYVITMALAGRGWGKAQAIDLPILSVESGFIRNGDLVVGDKIFDENGKPTTVLATHEVFPSKSYRLTFSDGETIDCCADHLWTTWEHRDRKQYLRQPENKNAETMPDDWVNWSMPHRLGDAHAFGPKVRTTQEIVDSFTHSSRGDSNHSVPVAKPLQFPHKEVPLDPYIYGYWLGDGSRGRGVFTADPKDQESLIFEIKRAGFEVGCNVCPKTVSALGMCPSLRALGTLNTKDVHTDYLYNSYDVRMEFLRGLMDSDGYVPMEGESSHVEFCSMRKDHAETVKFLACSVGYKAVLSEGRATLNGVDHGTKYRVKWTANTKHNPFKLPRKMKLVRSGKTQQFRHTHRMITNFEVIENAPMRCLSVDSPNRLYLSGKTLIPTHNTFAAASTVKRAVDKHKVTDILIIAPTARDFRSTIAPAIVDMYPPDAKDRPYWSPSKASIIWPVSGAIAICVPAEAGEDAVRGLNNELIVLDELGSVPSGNDILTQALLTLRREPSKMIITTTPRATPQMIDLVERSKNDDKYIKIVTGRTNDNLDNLSKAFQDTVIARYEGTTLGRQELEGELILTNPSALWQQATIDRNMIEPHELPQMKEISLGVDPSILARKSSVKGRNPDATGLILSGLDHNGILYSLNGYSGSYSMSQWVDKVCVIFDQYSQMCKFSIVIEINVLGKEAVEMAFIKAGRQDVVRHIKTLFATNSKLQRASPYSLLAEQNKIKYCSGPYLKPLSMELTTFDGKGGKSPNEYDAFMWSLSQLVPAKQSFTQVFEFLI